MLMPMWRRSLQGAERVHLNSLPNILTLER